MSIAALVKPVARAPVVDITIPAYNQERSLAPAVRRLHAHVKGDFPYSARITIADNASTDGTAAEALKLAVELPDIRLVRLNRKGKGRAVAASWLTSDAQVVVYMDVDLTTGLSALLPLVAPIISGHSDISIGSRLAPGARLVRRARRERLSRGYNFLVRLALGIHVSDVYCGFKAARADVARRLVPGVLNRSWFFDTELLVQAQRAGLRIHELPVDWVEDADPCVDLTYLIDLMATSLDNLQGVLRLATDRRVESVFARPRPV
jgi:glycosyltransferase involved in cell wall biosynthesis